MAHPSQLSRRFLLKTATAAAISPWTASLASAFDADGKLGAAALRLSASSINFSRLPIEDACRKISELGFEAVDIWSAHAGCPHLDEVQQRLGGSGLLRLLNAVNLKLNAFSVYAGGYRKYAQLLGECGGGVAVQGSTGPCDPADLVPKMRAFLESLQPDLESAEKYDSYLAIENHGNALLDSCDSLKAFTDLNRHPRLGIALAPYHILARGEDVSDAIRICGGQLLYFYAWQNAEGLEQLPGYGPWDFTPWLASLRSIGYARYVNPFMHDEPEPDVMATALARSRDYLRERWKAVSSADH